MATSTSTKPLTIIVAATSPSLGIGRAGSLPWRLQAEIKHFARVTKRLPPSSPPSARNAVIMGRKTWFSIPPRFRPLPDRINVVVSRTAGLDLGGGAAAAAAAVMTATSLEEAVGKLHDAEEMREEVGRVFVIGGAEVYRTAVVHPQTRNVLLTRVDAEFECDTFFPDVLGEEGWVKAGSEELDRFVGEGVPRGVQKEGGVEYEYELWQKLTTAV